MNWSLFWEAAMTIATFLVVVVALWQTRIAYKKKLKLRFCDNVKIAIPSNDEFIKYVSVSIVNIGNRKITINSISISVNEEMVLFFSDSSAIFSDQKFPHDLEIEKAWDFYIRLEIYIKNIRNNILPHGINVDDRIRFNVIDSTGKRHVLKSKWTYRTFLEKYEKENLAK
jgi:uncharacterized protein YpiB (UPF0302 family)